MFAREEFEPRLAPALCRDRHHSLLGKAVTNWLSAVLLLLMAPCVHAQIETGRLLGTVKDSTGAIVPQATVVLTRNNTLVPTTVFSTPTGTYVFEAQSPGTYTLQASAPGFKLFKIDGVEIHVQQNATIDIALSPGPVTEEVEVTAAAPLLQAEDASLGQTIGTRSINDMPLNGRNWVSLSELAAGVSTSAGGNSTSAFFTVNGINYHQNDIRLNGIDDNVEIYADSQISTNASITPPPDAIQEFKLENADFSAEFGHSTAGIVNAVTKSGGNAFHGDIWEYLRNEDLDANDYFNDQTRKAKPEYRENQYGGTLGGPVWIPKLYNGRDKTFFFFDYQGTRIIQPSNVFSTVPTALMASSGYTNLEDLITYNSGTRSDGLKRTFPLGTVFDPATTRSVAAGAIDPVSSLRNTGSAAVTVRDPFFTGPSLVGITNFTPLAAQLNQLPASRLDPNAVKLLGVYPAPTLAGFANNYYQSARTTQTINQVDSRFDETLTPKDNFFVVYSWAHFMVYTPGSLPGIANGQGSGYGTKDSPHYEIAGGYTHAFSPTLTNDFHYGYLHNIDNGLPIGDDTLGIPEQFGIAGIPQVAGNGGLPAIDIGGLSNIGIATYDPTIRTITTSEFSDNVTKIYRSHAFKTGYLIDLIDAPITQAQYPKGFFNYTGQFTSFPNASSGVTGIADLLLTPTASTVGGPNNVGGVTTYGGSNYAVVDDKRNYMGAYIQDDWKATPTLTFNLGLRWDLTTPYWEGSGHQANFQAAGGNGPTGTYYLPEATCNTPRSASFNSLAAKDGIAIACIAGLKLGTVPHDSFAPRVGFAYRVTPNFVVRGGYGIAYGNLDSIGFGGTLGQNYPFLYTVSATAPNSNSPLVLSNGQTATMENALLATNLTDASQLNPATNVILNGRQFNFQEPYTETFNLTMQYQFSKNDSIQLGYVGTLGRHLDTPSAANTESQIVPPGASYAAYVPFPDFSPNSEDETTNAASNYNSMQLVYNRRLSHGLQVLANYTFAKCLTDQIVFGGTLPLYRAEYLPGFGVGADYQLCPTDVAQVVHASGMYELPVGKGRQFIAGANPLVQALVGGWAFNFIFTHQTGQPFTVPCPTKTTAFFGCNANLVPGVNKYAGPHNQQQWLNPAAFANPPIASATQTSFAVLGGEGEQARGPSYLDLDASLFKDFPIHEQTYLQFRAETFNLTNTPQFSTPGSLNFENATGFSKITSEVGTSRKLQFALKLYY
jgi:hypothetical protein